MIIIYLGHGGANFDIKQLVYEITLYIHDNYSEPINVIDISDQALLSPSYFSSVFRVLTGYTVKNYVNRYRLYRAAIDLCKTNKQIIQIAFESGFLSQQSFTKSFSSTIKMVHQRLAALCCQMSSCPENLLHFTNIQQLRSITKTIKMRNHCCRFLYRC